MRNKKNGLILLLIFILLISGCSQGLNLVEAKEDYFTYYENDNIKIKISNKVKNKEETYNTILEDLEEIDKFSPIEDLKIDIDEKHSVPNIKEGIKCNSRFIKTEEFKREIIKKSYGIYDNWISEGLYGKIFDKNIDENFTDYYANNDFSLFGARFFQPFSSEEEIDNLKSASIDLVDYLIENDKKDELLKNEIEVKDIEGWAEAKKIDLSYQSGIESLMNRFEVYDLKFDSILTLNTKEDINGYTIDISTEDEDYDTAEKIEEIILNIDYDILQIRDGIKVDAPKFYEEYKDILDNMPKRQYRLTNSIQPGGLARLDTGLIELGNLDGHAHEYGHILMEFPFVKSGLKINRPDWLDEGIAEYLSIAYTDPGFQFYLERLKELDKKFNILNESEIAESDEYDLDVIKVLKANDIDFHNGDSFKEDKYEKMKAYRIIIAPAIEKDSEKSIREIFNKRINEEPVDLGDSINAGNYMSYGVNFGFVNYLVNEYGLEHILYLNVGNFSDLTYKDAFGRTYEELKSDWIQYLKDNIKDIELLL